MLNKLKNIKITQQGIKRSILVFLIFILGTLTGITINNESRKDFTGTLTSKISKDGDKKNNDVKPLDKNTTESVETKLLEGNDIELLGLNTDTVELIDSKLLNNGDVKSILKILNEDLLPKLSINVDELEYEFSSYLDKDSNTLKINAINKKTKSIAMTTNYKYRDNSYNIRDGKSVINKIVRGTLLQSINMKDLSKEVVHFDKDATHFKLLDENKNVLTTLKYKMQGEVLYINTDK